MKCPKCKKWFNKIWKRASKFNILTWNDELLIYKCKRCNHKWLVKHERLYVDCTSSTYYEDIPQWFLDKLSITQKKLIE